ncbi:DUF11 domain-containing protein [Agromyces mediolanus]|uniref:DUF11 domain-containing protein n=1 Tax=Agromyces mediolanus TaxID=41986 RepID=UPI002041524F|nr:DUF11 domain-containing protein [Agromyces mediolanus]MCM3658897.1 DUF11 domain-containing protein [Agromyces mediolanus]
MLASVVLATGSLAAVTAGPVAPAAAASPLQCGPSYGLQIGTPQTIWQIDQATGAQTTVARFNFPQANLNINAMGISADGRMVYGTGAYVSNPPDNRRWVFAYDMVAEGWANLGAAPSGSAMTHGAINLATGVYYWGGMTGGTLNIFGFNPATNQFLGRVASGAVPQAGSNGDFAFDAQGNLFYSAGANGTNVLGVIEATLPTAPVSSPVAITGTELNRITTPTDQAINGLAFVSDGSLILSSNATVFTVNPTTGAVLRNAPLRQSGTGDLASCASPNTIEVQKDLPDGRKAADDQVTMTITGGGVSRGNSATTAGETDGVQPQKAGPVLALAGVRYTVTETGSGSDANRYDSSWRCVDQNSGAVAAEGAGRTGSFEMPNNGGSGAAIMCTFTNTPYRPALELDKSVTPDGALVVGETLSYSFVVTNSGNIMMQDVAIDETSFTGSGELSAIRCPAGQLAPGDAVTCTASYTVQQADIDRGSISNTAEATGSSTGGEPVRSSPDTAVVPQRAEPSLLLTKTASRGQVDTVRQPVGYEFLVSNNGNVTIDDIRIEEGDFNGAGGAPEITCPATTLAPQASMTCTAVYRATVADFDRGDDLVNTATATGTTPTGERVDSNESSATVEVVPAPALEIEKLSDATEGAEAGDTITYTFWVTNTGNVTLDGIAVRETEFSGTGELSEIACPGGALQPGEQARCTATYTLTQADVDRGELTNVAVATGTDPGGNEVESPEGSVEDPLPPSPALSLTKSARPDRATRPGERIVYSFLVTNTGNVTLHGVRIREDSFSGAGPIASVVCPPAADSLRPDASVTCYVSYVVTQADLDRGEAIRNTATATGLDPNNEGVESEPSPAEVTVDRAPGIEVKKSADGAPRELVVGQKITYRFVVTNTGNVTLADVGLTEQSFDGSGELSAIDCPADRTLAPRGQLTCTARYTVTQEDVDRGSLTNSVTATGTPPEGSSTEPTITSPPSEVSIPEEPDPSMRLEKAPRPVASARAGEVIEYEFRLTNTGNVTLRDLEIAEGEFNGAGDPVVIACPDSSSPGTYAGPLRPGASVTCIGRYTLTQADLDSGDDLVNTATATATPPSGGPIETPPATAIVELEPAAGISIVKSVEPADGLVAGETLHYSFVVTNTGNVTLTRVYVSETQFTGSGRLSAITCPERTLAPGEQTRCTASYEVQQDDVDRGRIYNAATVMGQDPLGTWVTTTEDDASVPEEPRPELVLRKLADPGVARNVGETITYSFVATNTGNVTLTDVAISEGEFSGSGELSEIACPEGASALRPGETVTCTASYRLTQADVDSGELTNTATATGTPPGGGDPVTSNEPEVRVPVAQHAAVEIEKTADVTTISTVGERVTYSFAVTNTGSVTLGDVAVAEGEFSGSGELSAVSCPAGASSLAPGETVTCTASYLVTRADLDRGLQNTATAFGTPPGGGADPVESEPSTVEIPSEQVPGMSIVKSADTERVSRAGEVIVYSFTVTNTGNVPLTGVTVDDVEFSGAGALSAIACPPAMSALPPGQQLSCTASYVVLAADLTGDTITNVATVTATPAGAPGPVTAASPPAVVETESATPPPPLAVTGIVIGGSIALAVVLLLGGILIVLVVARRRARRT